jgi:flavin-dependent dehydrogenase
MPLKRIYSGRVMLVGDATGAVDPWTGGVINLGFHSAETAAKVAVEAIKSVNNGNGSDLDLRIYQDNMKETFKILRFKGNLLKFVMWCYNHKLTCPQWERFLLRHTFPIV